MELRVTVLIIENSIKSLLRLNIRYHALMTFLINCKGQESFPRLIYDRVITSYALRRRIFINQLSKLDMDILNSL